ncbi:uncharacterized protein LOC119376604, partial [Rhipicephalus sanguineus]|uniref:uncharacterized protein LOC119376604 n=1 Tax=Rhipicephalus sanguineus TaxID=34632 RepID=UPI0020C40DDA
MYYSFTNKLKIIVSLTIAQNSFGHYLLIFIQMMASSAWGLCFPRELCVTGMSVFFSYLLNKWIEARQKKGVVPEAGAAKVSAKQPMEQTVGSFVQVGAKHPAECPTKQLKKLRVGQPTGPVEIPLEETTEQPSGDIEMKSPSRDSLICTSPCSSGDLVIDEGLIASPSPAPTSVAASDSAAQADTAGLPCPEGDQGYDLWELTPGGKRVLLRHQAWNDSDGQLCMVTVKPEYQSLLGAEVLSTQEQVQQMARLAFFSRLLR